jgi:hypothetical protein
MVAEVLPGWTRASVLFVLLTEIGTWGCGALILQTLNRRWNGGWVSLLLLGLALAAAEECLIQQTSLAPMVGLAKAEYGRVLGVNWVYLTWALGFESIWVVVLPVRLVELIYPERRAVPWARGFGLGAAGAFFVLACLVAWASWTQYTRVNVFHMPPYEPPLHAVLIAIGAIALLVLAAFLVRRIGHSDSPSVSRRAPNSLLVGTVAAALALPWCALPLVAFDALPWLPWQAAIAASLAWALLTAVLMARWTCSVGWGERRWFAVVTGGIAASMASGFLVFWIGGALKLDWIGKAALDAVALALLAWLGVRVSGRSGS